MREEEKNKREMGRKWKRGIYTKERVVWVWLWA
jgi:hypothetical protein